MAVGLSSWKENGNGNGKERDEILKGACWNCGEMGHRRFKCKKPKGYLDARKKGSGSGGGGNGDSNKKSTGSANAVMEDHETDSDGVFAVSCETKSEFGFSSTIPTSPNTLPTHGCRRHLGGGADTHFRRDIRKPYTQGRNIS